MDLEKLTKLCLEEWISSNECDTELIRQSEQELATYLTQNMGNPLTKDMIGQIEDLSCDYMVVSGEQGFRAGFHAAADIKAVMRHAPGTNADLIRHMTDKELAVTLMCPNETGMAKIKCDHSADCNCAKCCLDWLQSKS